MPDFLPCNHLTRFASREDAMEAAERLGALVIWQPCCFCMVWHLCSAASEEEADRAGAQYRRELAEKFPAMAKQRGWANA